jgi:uracil-DNA glycosylase
MSATATEGALSGSSRGIAARALRSFKRVCWTLAIDPLRTFAVWRKRTFDLLRDRWANLGIMVSYSSQVVRCFSGCPNPSLLLVGEAPGPRGANRTGYPFWGDDAGLELYGLVGKLGLFDEPFCPWLREAVLAGTTPPAGRYAITNACTQMPFRDGDKFCAPTASRLDKEAQRLLDEIRCLQPKAVLTCGRAAAYTLARAALIEGSTPPSLLVRPLSCVKLTRAMAALLKQDETTRWRVGGALAFVTAHPARNQWAPSKELGRLHDAVIKSLRQAISSTRPQIPPTKRTTQAD